MAVGGGDDFYMLDRVPDYPLTFGVWGYFNLVGCELSNGAPGETFRHYVMLVSKDGCRMETQEEACHREDTAEKVQIH